jgi:uncharacterized protein GlcG (DUF336 family)
MAARAEQHSVNRPVNRPVIEPLEARTLMAGPADADTQRLTRGEVERILAAAGSQAMDTQIIAVVDREGNVLGALGASPLAADSFVPFPPSFDGTSNIERTLLNAITRARTAAFFQSTEDAFTTRTARFIIQDHFPHPVPNTPGGPLYGVQFSSLPLSDVYSGPAISGDPGGIPLYKNGVPVGGIGVAGDRHDIAARPDLLFLSPITVNRDRLVFDGKEESDFDERVALAGAQDFMAPAKIRATEIFLDGLRLPFTVDKPASGKPRQSLAALLAAGASLRVPDAALVADGVPASAGALFRNTSKTRGGQVTLPTAPNTPYPAATFAGVVGQYKNTFLNPQRDFSNDGADAAKNQAEAAGNPFGIRQGTDAADNGGEFLTGKNVKQVITDAVARAIHTRAAIRQPIGVPARVHVAVVDTKGEILGVFRMGDGTNFSFDVAVQKARTAAFFSDDRHAFSTRAVGFLSQTLFPVGINRGYIGPLRDLQNQLSLRTNEKGQLLPGLNLKAPLKNGITIFPGGVPLYKNGKLVGAVGISGDGVDQDDIIAFSGSKRFPPPNDRRSDQLGGSGIASYLKGIMNGKVFTTFGLTPTLRKRIIRELDRLELSQLDGVQLPYIKFPRDPDV